MLKFIKYHLTSIGHIEIYPLISFVVFFLFFLVMLTLILRSDKKFIIKMQNLPLEDSTNSSAQE
ncbi:MAG: CcoQ/FixQ family Cbb3-type cytochrome c oxidase assembly chaperone [Cytophagales bacterium]|nr:MAG: CcoQ/FixQ family Cbb3-type cytochrome c oxidase assembly chaperone [Cytophagales bacterium]